MLGAFILKTSTMLAYLQLAKAYNIRTYKHNCNVMFMHVIAARVHVRHRLGYIMYQRILYITNYVITYTYI